jgi:hypothetical protein
MKRLPLGLALLFALCASPAYSQVSPPVLRVEGGGTGASSPAAARSNLGAASAGANADITSLSGLATPLPPSEGGTGGVSGVSPTGPLTTTPEAVVNVADYGGCSGSAASDTANLNAALAAARNSTAYIGNQPVRVIGGYSTTGVACAVTQVNATGFNRFGGGARLLIDDLALVCSGTGSICLDTLGSSNVQFNKVTIIGSSSLPPMIGLQEGNASPANNACCIHTHYGLEITGSFTFAGLYSAASESTTYYSPIVRNNGAALGVIGSLGAIFGGSGYANGGYTGIALTGSATGSGATANILVSGGAVTSVTLTNQGKQYAIGDILTVPAGSLGGAGSGFSVPVANIGQFAMVLDGQNPWGVSSPFQSVNWPTDTYYTFTENNIIGGSLRYYGGAYKGAPLWLASVEGLRTAHLYIAQQAVGPCVSLFDNNAANTLHNISETLEIECESSSATYDVQVTGTNPTPNVSGLTVFDELSTVSTAILGVDAGITAVTAHSSNVTVGHSAYNVPLFGIGSSLLWNFDGEVNLQYPWEYNAPSSALVSGLSGGIPMSGSGPLCNIRRASDSSSVDLYPNSSGMLDKSTLSTFCANTSCFIATEYDQSGNGNPARNTNAVTQPAVTIEGAGLNYAACGTWENGGNVALTVSGNSSINSLFASGGFASVVSNKTAAINNAMRLLSKVSGSTGWELSGAYTLGYGYPQFTVDASAASGAWVSSSVMPATGAQIFDVSYSYASLANIPSFGANGVSAVFQSSTQPSGAISDTNDLIIGNGASGGYGWPGDICEVLIARQPLSAAQIDAIRRNQAVFYGIKGVL